MKMHNSLDCMTWEVLLADALDGLLAADEQILFDAHVQSCPACAKLLSEASRGREWLEFLAPEPEIPAGLVDRILAQTGPTHEDEGRMAACPENALPKAPELWQQPGFMGWLTSRFEPRLMMTAAMAFFSLALTLNLSGIRITQMHAADFTMENLRALMERRIETASTPLVRYYDHLKLVDQVQVQMRGLRRESPAEEEQEAAPSNRRHNNPLPGQTRQIPPTPATRLSRMVQQAAAFLAPLQKPLWS